jgi:hypothetical protein
MRQQPNYTCMLKNLKTVLHLNLGHFVVFLLFCVVLFWFGLVLVFFPLWWDNDRTTSETPSPGLQAEGLTPKLLRLKFYCIWTWRFFFSFIHFYSFSILSLSLSGLFSLLLISTLSLHVYIFETFFVSLFCFFLLVYLFFPFSLTSLLSISSHPSILNITIVIITS